MQWKDIDFDNKMLYVNHTLCYFSKSGKYVFEMHDTKTSNGKRMIPLTETAVKALQRQSDQKREICLKKGTIIDGFEDLVFVTRNNRPTQQSLVQECISLTVKRIQAENADFETLTPHAFRHTFETRALENGVQIKTLSRLLGHSDVQLTLNLYCHATEDALIEGMKKME